MNEVISSSYYVLINEYDDIDSGLNIITKYLYDLSRNLLDYNSIDFDKLNFSFSKEIVINSYRIRLFYKNSSEKKYILQRKNILDFELDNINTEKINFVKETIIIESIFNTKNFLEFSLTFERHINLNNLKCENTNDKWAGVVFLSKKAQDKIPTLNFMISRIYEVSRALKIDFIFSHL